MAMKDSEKTRAQLQVRGPMAGLWRIAVYYVVLFLVAFVLSQFELFEKVVFGQLERLSMSEGSTGNIPFQDVLTGTPGAEIGLVGGPSFAAVHPSVVQIP